MPSILIVGASRGIGLGLAEEFAARGWEVVATRRNDAAALEKLGRSDGKVRLETVDIADPASAEGLRARLNGEQFDAIVVNAGVGGPQANPRTVSREAFADLFVTNALGPVRLAELLAKNVKPGTGVVGLMTSNLGSVASNEGGGMELYRASKAALNSFTRSFAARHRDRGWAVLSLHPGWVRTDMGGAGAAIDVATSAKGLADVVERALKDRNSGFFDYRGQPLAW
ncbi:MAG TPA: SDR family oxidoreductase [Caulobacteraceae bacterium]|nr:SDR family oxidoreductase [Caulobacteraceae bacterium]